jgi:hypothetical protein
MTEIKENTSTFILLSPLAQIDVNIINMEGVDF